MATLDQTISVTNLRAQLGSVIEACAKRGLRFHISSNSETEAVLVGIAEWNMLNETLDILADRDLVEQIKRSESEIEEGETRPAEDVFNDIARDVEQVDRPPLENRRCRNGKNTESKSRLRPKNTSGN